MSQPEEKRPRSSVTSGGIDEKGTGPASDDLDYARSPHAFTADRMGTLVRIAERDPKQQVVVSLGTINKLYMSFLSVYEAHQEQTACGININGTVHLCSAKLQAALQPLIDQDLMTLAEADVLAELAKIERDRADRT